MSMLDQPLGQLARDIPGATQVFNEYDLDFCCGGRHSLREAAAQKGVAADSIEARLAALATQPHEGRDWRSAAPADLIAHILERYHARHREQLPELIRLAMKVEQVHGGREDCPRGLAAHLRDMRQELDSHMQKEEQVLFPMLGRGMGAMAGGPITVMRMEHDHHGESLQQVGELTGGLALPPDACNTWRALYQGLQVLRDDLMAHIHLENNILFENAQHPQAADA